MGEVEGPRLAEGKMSEKSLVYGILFLSLLLGFCIAGCIYLYFYSRLELPGWGGIALINIIILIWFIWGLLGGYTDG